MAFKITFWFTTLQNFLKYQAATRTLQKVKIPIVGFETCSKDHDFTDKNQFICAGKPGKDSCQGDSGSPLVVRKGPGEAWFQTGIVSFGSTVCGSSRPGVYTRVSNFIDWISDSLEA